MIAQTQCVSFKAECYEGIHNLLTDTIKIALYSSSANLGVDTTAYTVVGEISGTGYSAGGKVLTGATINTSGSIAYVNFDNVTWDPASFTVRGALIYNASKSNAAIAVLDFGSDKVAGPSFTIQMPPTSPTGALIRSA